MKVNWSHGYIMPNCFRNPYGKYGWAGNPVGYRILKLPGRISSIVGYSALLYRSYLAGYSTI